MKLSAITEAISLVEALYVSNPTDVLILEKMFLVTTSIAKTSPGYRGCHTIAAWALLQMPEDIREALIEKVDPPKEITTLVLEPPTEWPTPSVTSLAEVSEADLDGIKNRYYQMLYHSAEATAGKVATMTVRKGLTYMVKRDEANALIEEGAETPDPVKYPTLNADVRAGVFSNLKIAARFVRTSDHHWTLLNAELEYIEQNAIQQIAAAEDVEGIRSIYQTAQQGFSQLLASMNV